MSEATDDAGPDEPRRLSALDAISELERQSWENAGEFVETMTLAPERIQDAAHVDVGQTPNEAVYSENKLDLLHYEPRADETYDVPILLVYALINKPYILDLQPDRSVVRRLLEAGFDVYLIDWGEPSTLDTSLSLYDYVERYVGNCVDVVRDRADVDALNLFGYCMGGTMSAMYAALYPEKVRNLGLMATGLCYDGTGGVLERWGGEQYDPGKLVETFGNAPGGLLSVGFAMMDPVQNFLTKYLRLYDNLEDEEFVENFVRMERWVRDSPDVAGEVYREFIEYIYQDNLLMQNELRLNGRHVDVGELDMPILQLVAKHDHLVPPSASVPFNDVVPSDDVTTIESPTGHIGLSVSSKAHAEVWPQACEWFAARSQPDAEDGREADAEAAAAERRAEAGAEAAAESGDGGADPEGAADTAEATEGGTDEAAETESGEPAATTEPADVRAGTAPEGSSLEAISGIGPAYEERLAEAGFETVEDLAGADSVDLARRTTLSEKRVQRWIEQAEALVERRGEFDDG
ncbi:MULTISPECIES: class III poly(R)-hydroxyalkanoic acid synthase subunit PhaC [Halorussus]|uniref:class III poly(R)-hydroxyalkanoic acid synthase subunit PhaC n=1 Tax=Halorussus TaxID=1070314 RepID=UPI000E20D8FF|nr:MULTISPECIES: class III poly(R)-hydroxyalkanoic acid synthase subunit PhaC [Halorussus]NHN57838.1 class III poly(R)-hydroxyalkanoic acid synthase subunit PhaC [Halorussus sp. JP-T4]